MKGGYAPMQAVWIPFEDAKQLCEQLKVTTKFEALVAYNEDTKGPAPSQSHLRASRKC